MTSENCCCKKWCCRKRAWLLVVILLLVYFCLVPSRFKPTYETTGLRNPVVKNGKVDYFGAYEATYIDQLVPPEQNGMRDIIAACGPIMLEQVHLADTVAWEDMPTNDYKIWFETYWVPLCEHMSIDPYKKPRFYDKRGYYGCMHKLGEGENSEKLWERLVAAPWSAEDEPVVAAWVADYSPALDLFGRAVRKPNYVCWRKPVDSMFMILLPDIQSQRDFARSLRVRITERLGRGDIDGAWYDVMSMLHLARHFKKDVILVTNLVGVAIQNQAIEAAKLILLHPAIDEKYLERFTTDLECLPPNTLVPNLAGCEWYFPHFAIQAVSSGNGSAVMNEIHVGGCCNTAKPPLFSRILFDWLPLDRNIAGKNLTELLQEIYGDHWQKTPQLMDSENSDKKRNELCQSFRQGFVWQLLRLPLIRTRSQMVAERVFSELTAACGQAQKAFNNATANDEMLRTAIAILRYKNAHNDYPETLDDLVPEFLAMYSLNPFTGRANFVYKREPGELQSGTPTPFRLYVVDADGVDDGGVIKDKAQNDPLRIRVFF